MKKYAPWIDNVFRYLESHSLLVDHEFHNKLQAIYLAMSCIKPGKDDEARQLWLEVPRGTIKDFGDFEEYREEGFVETYEEFEKLWMDYYPDETKWYGFAAAKYLDEMFFYFDSRLIFSVRDTIGPAKEEQYKDREIHEFLEWLLDRVRGECGKLKQDALAYNEYIGKNLSFHKRTGRINRRDYWDIMDWEQLRLDKRLGPEIIDSLRILAELQQSKQSPAKLPGMTAGDYFRYCGICYDANDYFGEDADGLPPEEKYLRMADGRDGGLRNVDSCSKDAFMDWYHSRESLGAHPWEICRGGNSTHISLMVSALGGEWLLSLAGSSVVRVEETVRMAVALYEWKVPFVLVQAEEILGMVTGNDYIGIVPDSVTPRYCHSLFPEEDKVIDFMNLRGEKEKELIANAYWYPLKLISLFPG